MAFHRSTADAEGAGFRICKSCRPDQASLAEQQAATIAKLCRYIEQADTLPTLGELAKQASISAYHLHRLFKKIAGLTPRAYATAHRQWK
ncbi:MAG: AraC family transcriptional regulator [Burkholderiales bacterium]